MSEAVHAKVGKALCPRYWLHAWFNQSLSQNLGKKAASTLFPASTFQSVPVRWRKMEEKRRWEDTEKTKKKIQEEFC